MMSKFSTFEIRLNTKGKTEFGYTTLNHISTVRIEADDWEEAEITASLMFHNLSRDYQIDVVMV